MAKRMPASMYLLVFSSGVIGHRFFDSLIPLWLTVALLLCAILFFIIILCTTGAHWKKFAYLVVVFILAIVWTNFTATNVLDSTIESALEKKDVVISGKIIGLPVQTPYYSRFDFIADTLHWKGKPYPSPGKIRLKAYHNINVFKANQVWQLTVRLKRPHGYQNPGSQFNYETYLFEHRIRATGYIRNVASNRLLNANDNKYSISKFRARISAFIQTNFQDDPHHGILIALIVGTRGAMRDADWGVLQNTGTIHLVAISGLHIGLVFGLVMWLVARIWRLSGQLQTRIAAQTVAVMCGLVAGFCYALLAGMTIPTQRAVIMLSVVAISMLLKRRPTSFEVLLLALGVVLLIDPLTPLASGFWLSFCAVAVIIGCLEKRNTNRTKTTYSIPEKTSRWMSIQIGLSFGMAPLLLLLFHQLSVVSPLANLLAIPVIGFIVVPVALFGLCLFALGLPEWALLVFQYTLVVIEYLWSVLQFLADTNWSIWQPPFIPFWALMLASVGVVLLFFRPSFPARLTAILWFLPLLFSQPEKPTHGAFRYTMLEVGHGLASVVETQNHILVYDTGPKFRGGMDAGETVVVPYLKSRGIHHIDKLIISHQHIDHSGGYRAISSEFDINHLLAGVPDKVPDRTPTKPPTKMNSKLIAEKCRAGQQWLWDGVRFEVLWPLNNRFTKGNNASCVLMISSQFGSLLLTGDIESPVERILVSKHGDRLGADVLQVPHQGSKTSSTLPFLERVNPQLALLSSGYLNRFGHPHKVISQRYAMQQIPLINTAYTGALTIHFDRIQQRLNHRDFLNGYWFGL